MSQFNVFLPRAGPRSIVDVTKEGGVQKTQAQGDTGGVRFEDILAGELGGKSVRISAHAQERIDQRGINVGAMELDRIGMAMDQIAEKGGKESLLVTQDAAFVVSVENRTIITVMDQSELRDNVFTKIDSAMLLLD